MIRPHACSIQEKVGKMVLAYYKMHVHQRLLIADETQRVIDESYYQYNGIQACFYCNVPLKRHYVVCDRCSECAPCGREWCQGTEAFFQCSCGLHFCGKHVTENGCVERGCTNITCAKCALDCVMCKSPLLCCSKHRDRRICDSCLEHEIKKRNL